jgi:hypothetical protein
MANLSWSNIQEARNFLLKQCDWTQLSDVVISDEERHLWSEYRQQLRDITKNFTNPDQVIWPISPDIQKINES